MHANKRANGCAQVRTNKHKSLYDSQSKNSKKKGVTIDTMETIQKQGDSIDKLTFLMNELGSKLDKKSNPPQYKPRIHPGRNRGHGQGQNRYNSRDRSYSKDGGPYNNNN